MDVKSRYGGISKGYICPVCGKFFLIPYQTKGGGRTRWVYRRCLHGRTTYTCSYTCFRSWKKQTKDEKIRVRK